MKDRELYVSRPLHWLGWDRTAPQVAALLDDEAVWLLALRDRPLRVTACGAMPLPVGTVRNRELRLVGLAADALRTLRNFLQLPDTAPLTIAVDPDAAHVDSSSGTVVATIHRRQIEALSRCAQEADSTAVGFDPIPASVARLAQRVATNQDAPVYGRGAGWMTASPGTLSEVTTSGTSRDPISTGRAPSTLAPISRPNPIRVARGVQLAGPWQLLIGAALSGFADGPRAIIETREQAAAVGWAAEQIVGANQ